MGLHYVPRRRYFYTTFLETKRDKKDRDVQQATGGLTFDRATQQFKIGPREKLVGDAYKGTIVSFDDQTNVVTTEGYLKYAFGFLPKTATMAMAGTWTEDRANRNKVKTNLVTGINFDAIPKEAWTRLAEQFRNFAASV